YLIIDLFIFLFFFFFSSRRRHTRLQGDWSSDVCSSDLSHPYLRHRIRRPRQLCLRCSSMEQRNTIQLRLHRKESDSRTGFFLFHGSVIRGAFVLIVSLCIGYSAWPNADKNRKNAAKSLAQEIEQAQFHKVYVLDFLEPSGSRTEKGCLFSSTFSTN